MEQGEGIPGFCLDTSAVGLYILPVQDSITSTILSSMSDGVLVFDFTGRLVFSNRAGRELLGVPEVVGAEKRYIDLFMVDPGNDAFNDILFSGIQNHEARLHMEVPFHRADGIRVDLAVTTSFLRSTDEAREDEGVVVVFRDITESMALNRARQRVIDHLSHELKTPLAIITATLKRVSGPENGRYVERMGHNLARLQEIQMEVEDIVRETKPADEDWARSALDQMVDLLDVVAERNETYRGPIDLLKEDVKKIFDIKAAHPQVLEVCPCVKEMIDRIKALSLHREILLESEVEGNPKIWVDPDTFKKILAAPIKNAVEATPDGGEVCVAVRILDGEVSIEVRDTGVGITQESLTQIFGGFYHAKETDLYTTKKPFDFGAGGKGLDLLRLKVLSQVYNFRIECESGRCRFIPDESDLCPGAIAECSHVRNLEECAAAGGTTFRFVFPCR